MQQAKGPQQRQAPHAIARVVFPAYFKVPQLPPSAALPWVAKRDNEVEKKTNEFHGRSRVFTVVGLIHVPGGLELVAGAGAATATATAVDSFSSLIFLDLFSI